jgi:hypothetical protein
MTTTTHWFLGARTIWIMVSEEIDSFMWQRFSVHCDGTEDYPAAETSTEN